MVLTLTDGHLGEGNFITQSLLLLVEDVNDNEPIFKPYQSTISIREDSAPHILTTVEATDQDEGPYGQVNICLLIIYHHAPNSAVWHNSYECHLHFGST